MAFEKLNEFTDKMKAEYLKQESMVYLFVLSDYWATALQTAKFKAQKHYCEKTIYELCPGYYRGYFKKQKP